MISAVLLFSLHGTQCGDIVQSPTTHSEMNSNTYNKHLSFPADMSGPNPFSAGFYPQITTVASSDLHCFGVYQLTPVRASGATIRILVLVPISALPYRKALIAKLFFRQILGYVDSPSIFVNDLVSTVTSYFDMSTVMTEREVEAASISIRDSIFSVANLSGVGFLDSTGKYVSISDSDNRPRDVSYFTFRSFLNPNIVDPRAPNTVHQF